MEFKDLTKKDAQLQLVTEVQRLLGTASSPVKEQMQKELEGFERLFGRFINETGPSIDWDRIQKLPDSDVRRYETLGTPADLSNKELLNKLVVVKLNGGLGTSMGCQGPKSIIPVRSDLTFLDLTVQQIENLNKTYDSTVPLVLMNSFNTDDDTQKVIKKYQGFQVPIYTFNQSKYPRLNKESMMPIAKSCCVDSNMDA
ncbi:UNVERIFIED_CONTAM: hypothetical protein GTU68_030512 [Idotea baltica]|nr:hypothetical protein [Idotea baltica]